MYFKTSESSRKHHWQQLSWNLSENNLGNPDGWLWYRGEVSEYTMASNAIQTIMFKDRRRPKETHQALIGYMQGERIRGTSPVTPWQCLMKRPPSCVPLLLGLCRFLLLSWQLFFSSLRGVRSFCTCHSRRCPCLLPLIFRLDAARLAFARFPAHFQINGILANAHKSIWLTLGNNALQ